MNMGINDPRGTYGHRHGRLCALLLTAVLAMASVLTGCGGSGGPAGTDTGAGAADPAQADTGAVWKVTDVRGGSLADSQYVNYGGIGYADGHFQAVAYGYENSGDCFVYQIDGTGSVTAESPMGLREEEYPNCTAFDAEGNRYFLVLRWSDEETLSTLLIAQAPDGTELWTAEIDDGSEEITDYNGSCYVEGQGLFLRTGSGADLYSTEDGSLIRRYDSGSDFYGSMCALEDGTVLLSGSGMGGYELRKLDPESGTFSTVENVKGLDQLAYADTIFTGPGNSVLMLGNGALFKVDLTTGEISRFMDFLQSDMDITQISDISFSPEGSVLCAGSNGEGGNRLLLLERVDPAEQAAKETLIFGCSTMEDSVRRQIIAFNRASSKYRIEVRDYSQTIGDNGDFVEVMNNDIITGNIPDIIMLDSELPIESYIAKGIFEPLDSLIENDPEIRPDEYLTNIFNASRVGGKLYEIIPSFYVMGLAGRQSVLGDVRGLTVQEALQLIGENDIPMQTAFGPYMTQSEFLTNALSSTIGEYVDKDTGKCSFNSQGFTDLLELSARLPKEIDYENEEAVAELETVMLDGKALLCNAWLYNFRSYNELEVATVGEPVTLVGYPSEGKAGPSIEATMRLSVSASSKNKEAAWEFVRSFLTEEYQETVDFGYPVRREALERMAQAAQERPYYLNENGEKEYYDESFWVNGQEITSEPMTSEKADAFIAFLESLDSFSDFDYNVYNIVTEETGAFFSGQKSAQEVADTIQSRVQIYLNESR